MQRLSAGFPGRVGEFCRSSERAALASRRTLLVIVAINCSATAYWFLPLQPIAALGGTIHCTGRGQEHPRFSLGLLARR